MTLPARSGLLRRLERDTAGVALALAAVAAVTWPDRPARALGVLGGATLVAISYLSLRAGVDGALAGLSDGPVDRPPDESSAPRPARRGFVKFFTRHAMLALGAYVMMARFEFDPMAMMVGVSAPVVAASVECVRAIRVRGGGSHSRSS